MTERTDWQDQGSDETLEGEQGTSGRADRTSGMGGQTGGSSGVTGGEMTENPTTGGTDYGTLMGGSEGDLGEGGLEQTGGTGFEADRTQGGYGSGPGFEEDAMPGGAGNRSGSGSGGQGESAMYDEEEGDAGLNRTGA